MTANEAEGVAMCEAHPNLEVFRLRLGKALNYEFNEDTQTGLFQRRDPREGEKHPRPLPVYIKPVRQVVPLWISSEVCKNYWPVIK